jgi:starch synthase
VNPLKAGIVSADVLVAVSPTYARQITQTHGFGLEGLLAARHERLVGILNGVDDAWDPRTDRHLPAHFSDDDLTGKAICKAALQAELGLPVRADVPLFAVIARLDHQKGIDLVQAIAPWLLAQDVQLVLLGSGSPEHQRFLEDAQRAVPRKVRSKIGFDEPLAHRIEAAADVFLMPSRFEPCGLNQMYSMRYGTVPVVHATGGLADTVDTVDPSRDTGTGWAFHTFDADAFRQAIGWAILTYTDYPDAWRRIQHRGMTTDFSWNRSAERYERVYAVARNSRQ